MIFSGDQVGSWIFGKGVGEGEGCAILWQLFGDGEILFQTHIKWLFWKIKLRKSMKDKTLILLWVTSLPPWIHHWRAGSYCLLGLDRRKQTGQYSQHMEKMITEKLLHFVMQSGSVVLKAPGVFKKNDAHDEFPQLKKNLFLAICLNWICSHQRLEMLIVGEFP